MTTQILKFFSLITICIYFAGCIGQAEEAKSDEELINEFTVHFNEFYETYGDGDIAFVDYYAEDVISMDNSGKVTVGSEEYRDIWSENFKRVRIDKLEYTEPEIIFSRDMIFTYNNYDERFIYIETGDTTEVKGTWIAVWKPVKSEWKVVMNTYHTRGE